MRRDINYWCVAKQQKSMASINAAAAKHGSHHARNQAAAARIIEKSAGIK